jgi:hypothetical protein
MAKLTHFNSKTICGAEPNFSFGLQFFSIGLSSKQSQVIYHLYLTPDKVRQFAAYVLANDRFLPRWKAGPTSP